MACFRLARRLRGGAHQLSTAVKLAIEAVGFAPDDFDGVRIPDQSTIQRHELTFDFALMLSEARRCQQMGRHLVRWA